LPVTVLHTCDGALDDADRPKFDQLKTRLAVGPTKVLLFLHGGLVDREHGEETATRLSTAGPHGLNAPADWEQIYVVWRTGALETIRMNWGDLATNDRLYRALLRRLLSFLVGKLQVSDGSGRSASAAVALTPAEIDARLSGASDQPFADIDAALARGRLAGRGAAVEDVPDVFLAGEFTAELQRDPDFTAAVDDIDAALNPARPEARGAGGPGDAAAGVQSLRRLDPDVQAELKAAVPPTVEGRFVVTSAMLIKQLLEHGAAIVLRIVGRYRSGSEHGIQATIVEELARELYGDLVGATIWGMMKKGRPRSLCSRASRLGALGRLHRGRRAKDRGHRAQRRDDLGDGVAARRCQ
jgi:hypothetical protein